VIVDFRNFADVPFYFWARNDIYAAARAGIVQGYPDGTYQPSTPVSREQMAVYISRALAGGDQNVPEFTGAPSFPDVGPEHWAFDYVEHAVAQSVVGGYEDGCYHPEYEVTRDQMAVYVARALVAPSGEAGLASYVPASPRGFPDVTSDFWAYRHVEYCVENGVVQGYADGYYHPDYVVTRDQMAVYVARAFGLPRAVEVRATIEGPPNGSLAADVQLRFHPPGGSGTPLHTRQVSLNGTGRSTSDLGLPVGTYDVWAKAATHLARRVPDWSLGPNGAARLDFGVLLAGDLVDDNVVDQADFDYMQSVWGTGDPIADINRDGVVNTIDFAILNGNWGKAGDW
jgi:hypothetical protein